MKEGKNMVVPEKYVLAKTDDYNAFQSFENWLKTTNFIHHVVEPIIMTVNGRNKVVYSVYIRMLYSDNSKTFVLASYQFYKELQVMIDFMEKNFNKILRKNLQQTYYNITYKRYYHEISKAF